jgi:energy-coupling factor transporter ATP-binding protein EcfA2
MRIIRLSAENIKRLTAVEITPTGDLVVIGGRNGQGKTSVLDALWLALGGANKANPEALRHGSKTGHVTVDLGDLQVTRSWTAKGSTLTVKGANGATYPSPQKMLDDLVGRLSFDPLAFTNMKPKDQVTALVELADLPVDLEVLAEQRAAAYNERTVLGRELKSIQGAVAVGESELGDADTVQPLRLAEDVREELANAEGLQARHEDLEKWLAHWVEAAAAAVAKVESIQAELEGLPPIPDAQYLIEELAAAQDWERKEAARAELRARREQGERMRGYVDELTSTITKLDESREEALAAAKLPIEGLTWDEDGVRYNGVPFVQCSGAERLRVSVAMAMAANPQVRVLRIEDGSLLDSDSLEMLRSMAETEDFQVWIERVGDGSEVGIVIEDGAVARDDQPPSKHEPKPEVEQVTEMEVDDDDAPF